MDTTMITFAIFNSMGSFGLLLWMLWTINQEWITTYIKQLICVKPKSEIIIEGTRCRNSSGYNLSASSLFSNRFLAVCNYITVNKLGKYYKEIVCKNEDMPSAIDTIIVVDPYAIKIYDNIYAKVTFSQDIRVHRGEMGPTTTDIFKFSIYSQKLDTQELMQWIDGVTENYIKTIQKGRIGLKYIYSLSATLTQASNVMESLSLDIWREDKFESSRTFNNVFFDGKSDILKQIDFFINNKEWYDKAGIPYTLGIGLYGEAGTGKTSFIKALANLTNRHIVVINLKQLKTKKQLEDVYFQMQYNQHNSPGTIGFADKIIVFEDIDCMGQIVSERSTMTATDNNKKNTTHCIALDDLLNLWDGIRETPGRILVITSNHYNKLDKALVRPGRIDITHEMKKASTQVAKEIYYHLTGKQPNVSDLPEPFTKTPAELVNIYCKK